MYVDLVCQHEPCGKAFRSRDTTQQYCSQTCGARASSAHKRTDDFARTYVETRIHRLPGRDACWNWTGFVTAAGYGRAFVGNKIYHANELVYRLHKSPIPDGLVLTRTCGQKLCVNPAHHRVGTKYDSWELRQFVMARIKKSDDADGCWLWQGATDGKHGYGRIRLRGNRQRIFAHRVMYELFVGPIPENAGILHRCNVPACVNPEHLYPGTQVENGHDRAVAGTMRVQDISEETVKKIRRQRYDTGIAFHTLDAAYGLSDGTARAICRGVIFKHVDMTYVDTSPMRQMSPRKELTAEDKERMYTLRTEHGMTFRAIAELYGISSTGVMQTCRRYEKAHATAAKSSHEL